MPILPVDRDANIELALRKFRDAATMKDDTASDEDKPFDALPEYHALTAGLPQSPDYPSTEPSVRVRQPADRSGLKPIRPSQAAAHQEISRAVEAAVMAKHAQNPTDNVDKGDDELQRAQAEDSQVRGANSLGRIFAHAGSLIAGHHGQYDSALYNSLDKDADAGVKGVLQQRNEKRAQEDQALQMGLGKQQLQKNQGSLDRDAQEQDKTSNVSQGARDLLASFMPQLTKDPSFANMSAADIKQHFPILEKDIALIQAREHEAGETKRQAMGDASREKTALLNQSNSYKEGVIEHYRNLDARKEGELSGRSFQDVVPVPGKIPLQKQAEIVAKAADAHARIDNLLQHIQKKYAEEGPRYILPDDGRQGLQSDLEQLRIIMNTAEGQGAMSKGHYESMKRIVNDPDAPKNMLRPEFFTQNMDALQSENHENFRATARTNNYVTRGEKDFDDAVARNAVPTVSPAPRTPIPNPATVLQNQGGGASSGSTVSSRTPVAPGGMVKMMNDATREGALVPVGEIEQHVKDGWRLAK